MRAAGPPDDRPEYARPGLDPGGGRRGPGTADVAAHPLFLTDPEIRAGYAEDASGLVQVPAAVARPANEAEVIELVRHCAAHRIPLTAQGLRSSTTGSAVAARGVVVSFERMAALSRIDRERAFATAGPGIVTADLKARVQAAGLFYPPDPTSEEESTLGGNVATNASGSRTYRYGATRRYVRALRLVRANGEVAVLRRVRTAKNATGYYGFQDPIDLVIGSEGTLGLVTEVTVDLLPAPRGFFGALAFFRDWQRAIRFVLAADAGRRAGRVAPRCLEFFDAAALELLAPASGSLRVPPEAGAAIFFEEEGEPHEMAAALERWAPLIEDHEGLLDATIVAQSPEEKRALRRLRHAIPSTMDERGKAALRRGGRRVGTDFAVPLEHLPALLERAYALIAEGFPGPAIIYGHVGNGHPHINLLAEDAARLPAALATARRLTRAALDLDGTLTGEHGIGKVKTDYLREFYPPWWLAGMQAVKRAFDPDGILAPGNIFGDEEG